MAPSCLCIIARFNGNEIALLFHAGADFRRNLCGFSFRIASLRSAKCESVAFPAGNNMKMQMKYGLSCRGPVVLHQINSVTAKCLLHGLSNLRRGAQNAGRRIGIDPEQIRIMLLHKQNSMSLCHRRYVQNNASELILINRCRRNLSVHNLTKNTIFLSHMSPHFCAACVYPGSAAAARALKPGFASCPSQIYSHFSDRIRLEILFFDI